MAAQDRHVAVGPFDSLAAGLGESEVMDVEVAAVAVGAGFGEVL